MMGPLSKLALFRPTICAVSHMSVYPKNYIEPIFKKEDQEALTKSGEHLKVAHIPIKAARNNDTVSVFHDEVISKFTNYIMKKGNKLLARDLLSKTFEQIKRIQLEKYNLSQNEEEKSKIQTNPNEILHQAIENCRPLLQLTPIKRGGVTYRFLFQSPLTEPILWL
uniref:Small ribosomal subunit protein uS7 domain-containing protein n=1 Tax=Megaselia scalaris TaxID=36166 RepID=T1GAS7_MEGSC